MTQWAVCLINLCRSVIIVCSKKFLLTLCGYLAQSEQFRNELNREEFLLLSFRSNFGCPVCLLSVACAVRKHCCSTVNSCSPYRQPSLCYALHLLQDIPSFPCLFCIWLKRHGYPFTQYRIQPISYYLISLHIPYILESNPHQFLPIS